MEKLEYIQRLLVELLAIKLYEHDSQTHKFPIPAGESLPNWAQLHIADKELYRSKARMIPFSIS